MKKLYLILMYYLGKLWKIISVFLAITLQILYTKIEFI